MKNKFSFLILMLLLGTRTALAAVWDLTTAFPGADDYTAVTNAPAASTFCSPTSGDGVVTAMDGVFGTAICLGGVTNTSDTSLPGKVLVGVTLWDSNGKLVAGTLANNGTWNLTKSFTSAGSVGYYSAVSNAATAAQVCSGSTLFGTGGTAICQSGTTSSSATAADILATLEAWDVTGAKLTGTMVDRGTWDLTTAFPGSGKFTAVNNAPMASTICSTTGLAGTPGTAICEVGTTSSAAAAADILSGQEAWDGTGAKMTGTLTAQGAWDIRTAFPGTGKYTGITHTPGATGVCSGTTVTGTAGTAVCESGTTAMAAAASDILASKEAWDGTGAKMTGTMNNRGTLNAAATFPGSGFYSSTVSGMPTAVKLCSTVPFLGVTGSSFCGLSMASTANHDKATTQLAVSAEVTTYAGVALPSTGGYTYRDVPSVSKDTDGYQGVRSVYQARPGSDCGTTGTIAARIRNCNTSWDGTSKGNNGQGVWNLVTRIGAAKEVWQDQRTGLLWSSLLAGVLGGTPADMWCMAAGNNPTNDGADAQTTCNGNTLSYCAEASGMTSAVGGENWAMSTYDDAKGEMGATSSTKIRWRLPTRHDYQQAEIDGIRFVMPDMGINGATRPTTDTSPGADPGVIWEWAATLLSSNTTNAYVFDAQQGAVTHTARTNSYGVRCVGR